MNVKVKLIRPATKPHRLAEASVELADSDGDSILISDIRILQNERGLFVEMPRPSVCECNRSYGYITQIEPNRQLLRKIQNAVLDALRDMVLAAYKKSKAEVQA